MHEFNHNYCRICLTQDDLINIFEKNLADKLVYCASVQVSPEDSLPSTICKKCEEYLRVSYVFKLVCVWVDSNLKGKTADNLFDLNVKELYEKFQVEIPEDQKYNNVIETILIGDHPFLSVSNKISPRCILNNEETLDIITEDVALNSEEPPSNLGKSLKEFKKECQISLINSNAILDEAIEEHVIEVTEDSLNFHYDYHRDFDDKAIYRRVSLNSEDPLLLNVISKDLDVNEGNNELKKSVDLNNILLHDFENFEKKQINNSVRTNCSFNKTTNVKTENRVGRHIAKKNAGQPPKRYTPTLELKSLYTHPTQNLQKEASSVIQSKCQKDDENNEDLQKRAALKAASDTMHHEYILESDLSMPEPIFEETIITDSFYQIHEDEPDEVDKNDIPKRKKIRKKKVIYTRYKKKNKIIKTISNSDELNLEGNKNNSNNSRSNLNKKKHNQAEDNTCKICNKSFPFPSHLQRHVKAHIGVKHFTCKYCNKQYFHRYNLSVHIRSHTGNFPLHCKICNRGFASPSVLERHKRSHTGETPYQCRFCLRLFSHSSSLTIHEKMHLNRPSYTCDICFKVCSYKSSLNTHKKEHSGSKPYDCNMCHTKFTRKTSLARHMLSFRHEKI